MHIWEALTSSQPPRDRSDRQSQSPTRLKRYRRLLSMRLSTRHNKFHFNSWILSKPMAPDVTEHMFVEAQSAVILDREDPIPNVSAELFRRHRTAFTQPLDVPSPSHSYQRDSSLESRLSNLL